MRPGVSEYYMPPLKGRRSRITEYHTEILLKHVRSGVQEYHMMPPLNEVSLGGPEYHKRLQIEDVRSIPLSIKIKCSKHIA